MKLLFLTAKSFFIFYNSFGFKIHLFRRLVCFDESKNEVKNFINFNKLIIYNSIKNDNLEEDKIEKGNSLKKVNKSKNNINNN
jgi:hypothetical protein